MKRDLVQELMEVAAKLTEINDLIDLNIDEFDNPYDASDEIREYNELLFQASLKVDAATGALSYLTLEIED